MRPLRLRRNSGRQLARYLYRVRLSIPTSSQSSKHVRSFQQCKIHVHKATFFAALGCVGQLNLRMLSVFRRYICLEVQGSLQSRDVVAHRISSFSLSSANGLDRGPALLHKQSCPICNIFGYVRLSVPGLYILIFD